MKRYRVTESDVFRRSFMGEDPEIKRYGNFATELREQYGLQQFSIREIITKWREHSESSAASWLHPSGKAEIERVFDVKLEEIGEGE